MKFSIIAFFAIVSIATCDNYNLVKQDELNFIDGSQSEDSWPAYLLHMSARARRAANDDAMKTSVERMEMISRLANTIFLQQGLINGSIDSDALISELLHFGSVTPAEIHELDQTKMNEALTKLKDLPSKLKTTDAITDLEKSFDSVDTVLKEVEGVKDVTVWSDQAVYEKDIQSLADGSHTGFESISELQDALNAWDTYHTSALNIMKKTDFNQKEGGYLEDLGIASNNILSAGKSFSVSIPQLFTFTDGKSATQLTKFLSQLMSAVDKIGTATLKKSKAGFTDVQTNLDEIDNVIKSIQEIQPNLDNILNLLTSRSSPDRIKSVMLTVGLPQGFNDISRMLTQFNDPWFQEVVRDKRLIESFTSIKTLDNGVSVLDKTLGYKAESKQKLDKISSVVGITKNLVDTFSSYSIKNSQQVTQCFVVPVESNNPKNVTRLAALAGLIDTELNNLQLKLKSLQVKLSSKVENENLQKIAEICKTAEGGTPESWKTAYSSFANFKEREALAKFIGDFIKDANAINDNQLKSLAAESLSLFETFQTYLDEIKEHTTLLNCLIKQNDTYPTINIIQESKSLRDSKTHVGKVQNAATVVTSIVGAKNDLTALENSIGGIKGFQSVESDLLQNFLDAGKHSQVLGLSTKGVVSMRNAIGAKSSADLITKNSAIVKTEKNAVNGLSAEDKKNLDSLESLGTPLNAMMLQLTTWMTGVKESNSTTLADYANVFLEAKKVNGIDDLGKISASLGNLIGLVAISNNRKPLEDAKIALDKLDEIGLQFAGYQKNFDESLESLNALDLFFADFRKKISATTAPPITPQQHQSQIFKTTTVDFQSRTATEKLEVESEVNLVFWLLIIGVPIGFSVIGGIIFLRETHLQVNNYRWNFSTDSVTKRQKDKNSWKLLPINARIFKEWTKHVHHGVDGDLKETTHDAISDLVKDHKKDYSQKVDMCEDTRVILPTNERKKIHFKNDFLHANYVTMKNEFQMILTQGPQKKSKSKNSTIEKFWYVVKEKKCLFIVMLCQLFEEGKLKCAKYFPENAKETLHFDKFSITCTVKDTKGHIVKRTLVLSYKNCPDHTLTHYQYIGWPDKGVPVSSKDVVKILLAVRNSTSPVMVHCAAGIGRSGSFAFIEMIYQGIYYSTKNSGKVDYGNLLRELRRQRARCVQTDSQFAFCIDAVLEVLFHNAEINKLKTSDREIIEAIRAAWTNYCNDMQAKDVAESGEEEKK